MTVAARAATAHGAGQYCPRQGGAEGGDLGRDVRARSAASALSGTVTHSPPVSVHHWEATTRYKYGV